MSEAQVRQKLLCTFLTIQLKPHILYKSLSRRWLFILNSWICHYKVREINMKLIH